MGGFEVGFDLELVVVVPLTLVADSLCARVSLIAQAKVTTHPYSFPFFLCTVRSASLSNAQYIILHKGPKIKLFGLS